MRNYIIIEPYFKMAVENVKKRRVIHYLPFDPHFANAASKHKCNKCDAKPGNIFSYTAIAGSACNLLHTP